MPMGKKAALATLIPIAVGGVLLVVGWFVISDGVHKAKNWERADAEIYDITSYRNSDGDTSYTAWVTFDTGGETYKGRLDYWESGMHKGQTVQILYDPGNPNNFVSVGGMHFLIIILTLLSAAFTIAGLLLFVSKGPFAGR